MTAPSRAQGAAYREILRLARRFVSSEEEACDLAQDALVIALDRGFADWSAPERRPWMSGVLRRHAAYAIRTDQRRRRRERAEADPAIPRLDRWIWDEDFLRSLPRSLRSVAVLASADLCSAEIRWLLRLSPGALRTRLSALRRAVRAQPRLPTLSGARLPLSLGRCRAPLLAAVKRLDCRALAAHDPDGHAILFREGADKSPGDGNS